MPNHTIHEPEDRLQDFDYAEFDYKNTDDLAHKRHLRKLLEDKIAAKRLEYSCREEWDDDEDAFEWGKMDI